MSEVITYVDKLDDWKSEYLPRLQKSFIYLSLEEDCNPSDKEVMVLIESAVSGVS